MSAPMSYLHDLPDAETLGYETKKQKATDIRDAIKGLLQPRISELEALEGTAELAGSKAVAAQQSITADAKLIELNGIHAQILEYYDTITKYYVEETARAILESKLKTICWKHEEKCKQTSLK